LIILIEPPAARITIDSISARPKLAISNVFDLEHSIQIPLDHFFALSRWSSFVNANRGLQIALAAMRGCGLITPSGLHLPFPVEASGSLSVLKVASGMHLAF